MLMIDLCCGLKGASEPFRLKKWDIITLDIEPLFNPDIIADVRSWQYSGPHVNFIWASPPCDDYSRTSMPWTRARHPQSPDMSIFLGCLRVIKQIKADYWLLENVRGAVPYFMPFIGKPRLISGPFYLWGFFPDIPKIKLAYKKKESFGSKQKELRAKIPFKLANSVALAIESTRTLL